MNLREAAEQARTALNWAADHIPPQGDPCRCPVCVALDALEKALKQPEAQQRTSIGFPAIMDLMDTVPRGTFCGVDRGDAMRIWLLAASATEKAHGIKEQKK